MNRPVILNYVLYYLVSELQNIITKIYCVLAFLCKQRDVHDSMRRDIIMNTTNNMQLYRLIYYS